MTVPPRFIVTRCAWCNAHPCRCPGMRFFPCACGVEIVIREEAPMASYREHLESEAHQAMRAREEAA